MKTIIVLIKPTNSELTIPVIIDEEDQGIILRHDKWHLHVAGYLCAGRSYLHEQIKVKHNLHALGSQVDHKDRNKYNNSKSNLRQASKKENNRNIGKRTGAYSSQYKGVSWNKRYQKWNAQIVVDGSHIHIGDFKTEIEAAKAYDQMAHSAFKEFAYLNFPSEIFNATTSQGHESIATISQGSEQVSLIENPQVKSLS